MDQVALRLLAGARRMLGQSDVDELLHAVLELARDVTGASYAAFGELQRQGGDGPGALERFVVSGVDPETELAIGHRPRGFGVLGELLRNPVPLRLADIGDHPHSYGFPSGHPPMRTFLGVPVFLAGRLGGSLYLAEKAGGEEFTQDDEDAAVALAELAGAAIDNARSQAAAQARRAELERSVAKLDAMTQVTRAIGDKTDLDGVLELVAKRGRALVAARALLIELRRGDELVIAAGAGELPAGLIGTQMPVAGTFAEQAMSSQRGVRVDSQLSLAQFNEVGVGLRGVRAAAGVVVPLLFRGRAFGALLSIDRLKDGPGFSAGDVQLLEAFASSAATAVAVAQTVAVDIERLAAVVQSSADAIVTTGADGLIASWNPAAEVLYGYAVEEVLGRDAAWLATQVVPDDRAEEVHLLARVLSGEPVKPIDTARIRKDGTRIDVSLSVSAILDRYGQIAGMASIARDITERKRGDRTRERALSELADAQRLARLGSWSWDPATEEVTWSAQMYEIFGRDPARGPATGDELYAYVQAEDRGRVAASYGEAFGRAPKFELDFRILTPDGARDLHQVGSSDPAWPGAYVGTLQDVTDQRRAEQERLELMAAGVQADGANRAKSEFLARMSHELRTPLNSIMGFSQLIQREGMLDERQMRHLGIVVKASQHLLELINDVLDISRIEADRMTVSAEPVALAIAVEEALALVDPLAAERDVTVTADIAALPAGTHVQADRHRLRQVLLNLLANAIKYNRPSGRVEVSFARSDDGAVETIIADSGIGISADQLEHLYEPFERLGAEQTEVEGTGLGLALTRRLVEAMGGTIGVESDQQRGTTFTVRLAAVEAPAGQTDDEPAARALGQVTDAVARKVLYIEDNLSNLHLVEEILDAYANVELIPAMLGTVGLELAREHAPDLLILDLHLPGMSGLEVLKRLKADAATRHIPVLVLTADATKAQEETVLGLGALAYMTKPLDVGRFLTVLSESLSSSTERTTAA